jgi:hypothetical protein
MALTPEKKVKNKVVRVLKAEGVYYFFPATHGMGRSGVPDIICCVNGRFLAVEVKAGRNEPTRLQERELVAVQSAGGVALVINEHGIALLKGFIKLLRETPEAAKGEYAGADAHGLIIRNVRNSTGRIVGTDKGKWEDE